MVRSVEFQFLIGRLKTLIYDVIKRINELFQFLIGRLKTLSTKEKLRLIAKGFQFLIGRLKTKF